MKPLDDVVAKSQAEAIDERKAKGKVIMVDVDHPTMGKMRMSAISGHENSINHSVTEKFKGKNGKPMCRDINMGVKVDKDGNATMDSYSINEHEDWEAERGGSPKPGRG